MHSLGSDRTDRPFLGYVWEDADAVDKHATRLLVDVAGFVIGIQTAVSARRF